MIMFQLKSSSYGSDKNLSIWEQLTWSEELGTWSYLSSEDLLKSFQFSVNFDGGEAAGIGISTQSFAVKHFKKNIWEEQTRSGTFKLLCAEKVRLRKKPHQQFIAEQHFVLREPDSSLSLVHLWVLPHLLLILKIKTILRSGLGLFYHLL